MKYVERRFAPGSVEPWQVLKRNMAEQAQAAGSLASQSPQLEGRSRRKPDAGTSPPSLSRASLSAEPSFPPMRDSGDLMQWASDVSPGLSNASPHAQSSSPQASSTPAPPASGAVEPASSPWVVKRSECDQYRAIFQQVTSNEFVEPTVVRAVLMPSGLPVEDQSFVSHSPFSILPSPLFNRVFFSCSLPLSVSFASVSFARVPFCHEVSACCFSHVAGASPSLSLSVFFILLFCFAN